MSKVTGCKQPHSGTILWSLVWAFTHLPDLLTSLQALLSQMLNYAIHVSIRISFEMCTCITSTYWLSLEKHTIKLHMSHDKTIPTKWVRKANTQISLGISRVRSVFAVYWVGNSGSKPFRADSEHSGKTELIHRLIWVDSWRTATL